MSEPKDFSDRETVKKGERKADHQKNSRGKGIRLAMSTQDGRAWMWDLLGGCHCFETCFHNQSLTMAFRAGEQNIGFHLLADVMEVAPDLYQVMQAEARQREEENENG